MLIAHLSLSYLLSQVPAVFGQPLSWNEQLFVIASGYFLDLDLLIPTKRGSSNHHLLPTHTPFFALFSFFLLLFIFQRLFPPVVWVLVLISLFFHLVLDDLSYWLYLLGFKKESRIPQIFWFYPFDKRRSKVVKILPKAPVLQVIIDDLKFSLSLLIEIFLSLLALLVFLKQINLI